LKRLFITLILIISLLFSISSNVLAEFMKVSYDVYLDTGQQFTPLDLSSIANMDFADDVVDDGKGGWTDQGAINDMRYFDLRGLNNLCGVDFNIIEPETNNGKACVVLRGQNKMTLPTSVEIPVEKKGAGAYFLHSSAWVADICGRYIFVYEDGTEHSIDIRGKKDVFNWWGSGAGERTITAWSGKNDSTGTVSLYMFAAENPYPDKVIEKIRMETDGDGAFLMIVAVTLTDKGPYLMEAKDVGNRDTSNWYPYELPEIDDIQGTILDMSFVLDAPAGKHGFLKTDEEGHLFFEDGTKVKFWGVNCGPEVLSLSYDRIDKVVDRIAAQGFNLVRFHQMDRKSVDSLFGSSKDAKKVDPYKMDRMCYFIAKMKEKGIYLYLDQIVLLRGSEDDNHLGDPGKGYKRSIWYDERSMEMAENYIRQLMGWYNPYTGYKIAEDPVLAFVTYANESSMLNAQSNVPEIYHKEADREFCEWLTEKYGTEDKIREAWRYEGKEGLLEGEHLEDNTIQFLWMDEAPGATTPRHDDTIQFGSDAISAFYDRMTKLVRGMGCKALLSPTTYWGMRTVGMGAALAKSETTDTHAYWSHPELINNMRTGTISNWNKPVSMLETASVGIIGGIMSGTIYGMPHTITEWEECEMNPRLAESGVLMAAFASLQDWHPLYFGFGLQDDSDITASIGTSMRTRTDYNDDHGTSINRITDFFSLHNKPIKMATIPVASVMHIRGDIKEADKEFYIRYSSNDYYNSIDREHVIDFDTGLIGKVGTSYDNRSYDPEFNDNEVLYLAEKAKKDKYYVSITGELATDLKNKTFQLNTERSQAASGFISGKAYESDDMITEIENEFATVTLISLSNEPIWDADKLLLTVAGDARNTGEIRSADGMEIVRGGWAPILVEPITGKVTIKTHDDISVYRITSEGTRRGLARTEKDKNGYTVVYLSEDDCVMNYEIVREKRYDGNRGPNKKIVFGDNKIEPLFTDLEGYEWAEKQITRNALQKIMRGISATEFGPDEYITKEDVVISVSKALKFRGGNNYAGNFADVSKDSFAHNIISKSRFLEIIEGDENGNFNQYSPITRQELMKILVAAAKNVNQPLKKTDGAEFEICVDKDNVAEHAVEAVQIMMAQDYVKEIWGNKIEPHKYVTRAEVAYILYGMLWY